MRSNYENSITLHYKLKLKTLCGMFLYYMLKNSGGAFLSWMYVSFFMTELICLDDYLLTGKMGKKCSVVGL